MLIKLTTGCLVMAMIIARCSPSGAIADCESLLKEYATSCADFMLCAVSNARPIRLCSTCVGEYNGVLERHKSILDLSESDNITCKDRLMNLDRLEIIEAGFIYVTDLWQKGRCRNCFGEKETSQSDLSNDTLTFIAMYVDTDTCLNTFYNPDNQSYSPDVCNNCTSQYYKMNVFYDKIKRKLGDGQICMDIVDTMNITQNLWSGVLHCGGESMTTDIILIVTCSIFLSLPVLFYAAAWKVSSATPTPVSLQKRLSTRFIQRLRTRTGSLISQLRQ